MMLIFNIAFVACTLIIFKTILYDFVKLELRIKLLNFRGHLNLNYYIIIENHFVFFEDSSLSVIG